MQKVYNFNGLIIQHDTHNLKILQKNNYGLKQFFLKKLKNRFEINDDNFSELNTKQKHGLFKFLFELVPQNKKLINRLRLNIYLFDFLHIYKGWRHLQGLPVRGQRTWSNAWSVYKNNLILRQLKLEFTKKIYNNLSIYEMNLASAAEQYNLLWKLQWETDWLEAKKKRLNVLKNKTAIIKVDLNAMAKGQITKLGKTAKLGKKKREFKKNVFNLGFDIGFTQKLFKTKKHNVKAQVQIAGINKKK